MREHVQNTMTAGFAIVGAGVIAVTPIAANTSHAVKAPEFAEVSLTANVFDSALIVAQGIGQTGLNLAAASAQVSLSQTIAAIAIATGDRNLLYSVIRQNIDAPLWAIDPTIDALTTVLPAEQAVALRSFRDDVLWAATDAIRTPIRDILGAQDPDPDVNPVTVVTQGLADSTDNLAKAVAAAPLGIVAIAVAMAEGSNEDLYLAIREFIDAPLRVADPTLKAFNTILSAPLGGDDTFYTDGNTSVVTTLRNDVLWKATEAVREPIREALGVAPGTGDVTPTEVAVQPSAQLFAAKTAIAPTTDVDAVTVKADGDQNRPVSSALSTSNLGKFAPGSTTAESAKPAQADAKDVTQKDDIKKVGPQAKASGKKLDRLAKKLGGGPRGDKNKGSKSDS